MSLFLLFLFLFLPGLARADFNITSATINGGSSVTVAPGETITVAVTLAYSGNVNGANGEWGSTRWTVNGVGTCNDHNDREEPGPDNVSFTITAPATPGTHTLTLKPYSNDNCGGQTGSDFNLNNAITVQQPTPVADFRFDECSWTSGAAGAVIDSTGSYSGTPYSTNTVSGGVVNRAADLSATGTSDYIHWPITLLNGRTNFTISLWFKTSVNKSQQEIIHGLGSGTGDDEIEIYLMNSTGIRVNIFDNGNNYTVGSSFANGAWHHLAVTRSGTSVCVYLDSTSLGCNTRGSGALTFTDANSLLSGQEQDAFGGSFSSSQAIEAQLDEFKVFTTALSASSISSIYGNELAGNNWDGSARSNPCLTPMAEYRFEEASWNGTSGEVADSSGNGYVGTAGSLNATKPTTAGASPAITGSPGTCRYGVFTRANKNYIALPSSFPNLGSTGQAFTITAWIKTTNNANSGQRILIDDEHNSSGYGFSLGDGGAGRLRFFSRGTPSQLILDTVNVIANNNWYFVAAVADVPNKIKRIYAFNSAGTLLTSVSSAAWTESSFGSDSGIASIGGETNASGENSSNFGFSGNIDEVNVFTSALSQSDLASVMARTHPCTAASLDHIRLEHDGDGLTCMPETITIKACANSDCTSNTTDSTTVTLSGTGWSSNPITFTGTTTVTLSKATPQTVILGTSSVSPSPAGATRCYIGVNQDCNLIFSGAGFIIASIANGNEATIPSQTAGTSSTPYFLRAIKTNTTTGACEAALVGANSVELAYECNDPANCYAANLMSVNGGTATTIARNNNGNVTSYTPSVPMTFDAGGNAQFTFNYGDVGRVTLHVRKTVNAVLLAGASNSFIVKPHDFVVIPCASSVVGACTAAPSDPGLVGGGSVFARVEEQFKATITSQTSTGTTTPSFGLGSNSSTETVNLTHNRLAPTGTGTADGALSGATAITRSSFSNGVATVSDLSWSEVGVMSLTATNSTFLGASLTTTGTSANLGRFIPDHFAITPGTVSEGCDAGNFTYFGQDGFVTAFTITAQRNTGIDPTTYNYTGNFAKLGLTDWNNFVFTASGLPVSPVSILGASTTAPSGNWTNGIAAISAKHQVSRPVSPVTPASITVLAKPVDSDGVTLPSATAVQATATPIRYGRAVVQNAYGPEKEAHKMRFLTQYYNGSSFITNTDDTCTTYSAASLACGNLTGPVICGDVTASGTGIGHGQYFTLSAPNKTGALLYTLTVAPWLQYEWDNADSDYNENPSARANFGIYRGNDRIINWREIVR